MRADKLFDDARESRRVLDYIRFLVVRARKLDSRFEPQLISSALLVPRQKSRHDGRVSPQGNAGEAGCGRGRNAEEIHKHALFNIRVLVGEYAYRSAFSENFQDRAGGAVLLNRLIPGATPVIIDKRVHAPVRDGADQKMQRVAVKSLRKRSKFPRAHMPGEKKDALAPAPSLVEILEAVHDNDAFDFLSGVLRELGELSGHPAYLADHAADHELMLRVRAIGKRDPQVDRRRTPQRRSHRVSGGRKTGSDKSRSRPRQQAHQFQSRPRSGIL